MSKLYDVLKDKTDIINDIQKEFSAKCKFIIVMILSENPIIMIERKIVKFAAEIDAEFDFDTYI